MFLKLLSFLFFIAFTFAQSSTATPKIICYYNSTSFLREGLGKVTIEDLEQALPLCTHLVYGYAQFNLFTDRVESSNPFLDLDSGKGHFRLVTKLKEKYQDLKILLSVGGQSYDYRRTEQLYNVLEQKATRLSFSNSAYHLVKNYGFDGIDIAWEFPPVRPKKVVTSIGNIWLGFKKKIGLIEKPVDANAYEHRKGFTSLILNIKNAFKQDNLTIGVTVLPNVDVSLYYDVPGIIDKVDYVVLSTFDYSTPERNPRRADFTAPLYPLSTPGEHNSNNSVHTDITWWLTNHVPPSKILIGIPSYGRAWKLNPGPDISGVPPVEALGPATAGSQINQEGLLSWPEICIQLNTTNTVKRRTYEELLEIARNFKDRFFANTHANFTIPTSDTEGTWKRVEDQTERVGTYAFYSSDSYGEWISYEEPATATIKAKYVKEQGLGGFGLFNIDLDDFRGVCKSDKYPILKAAKEQLL